MQRQRIFKRFLTGMLAMMLVFTSVNLPAKAGAAAAIGKYAMSIAGRAVAGAIVDATDELDPNSPIHTLNYLLLGITQDKAALKCDELLNDVEELNKEMKESTDYISDMMNDLEEQAAKNALTDYINSMNNASSELTTTLWLEYETYLKNAAKYAENPTQTNFNNLESSGNILFDHMEDMYDDHQLTTMIDNYIGYASPYKPHVDPDDKKSQSDKQSYMDLLYEVCGTQYLFDHQKHAVLTSAVTERIGTLNQMIELEYAFVSYVLCEFETKGEESGWTESEINTLQYEFEQNQQKVINAINDIAEEYGEEMNHMVSYDDIHTTVKFPYESTRTITTKVRETGLTWTEDRDITYKSDAKSTRPTMDCYRVGVDGKTFIFLKDPVKASDLVVETEVWYRQAVETDLMTTLRAESTDWYNLLQEKNGQYEIVSNLSQVYEVIKKNPSIYASYKNNFLKLLVEKGELTEVAGLGEKSLDVSYLFMNSKDIAHWDKEFMQKHGTAYINAKWGNLKNMPTNTNGFENSAIAASKDYCNDDKNVMVMMTETKDAKFLYAVNEHADNGDIQVTGGNKAFEPGDIVEVKLKADKNYSFSTLYVDGELFADRSDYESMPKDENGYVTFYFAMPYHNVEVSATCVRDVSNRYKLTRDYTEGVRTDIEVNGKTLKGTDLFFGDVVDVSVKNPSGTYISNIELKDEEGNTIQKLSALNKFSFAMPKQDCVLVIECKETGGGSGTLEDPYQIPDEATWVKYADLTAKNDAHYINSHYIVTNDITFAERGVNWGSQMSGFKLGENGSLDGQGHILSNPYTHSALFTENSGLIKNLVVKGAKVINDEVNGSHYETKMSVGAGLVYNNWGVIDHCIVKGSSIILKSPNAWRSMAAGIVYSNAGTIRNSGYEGPTNVLRASHVAGIAYSDYQGTIENCYFLGQLEMKESPEDGKGAAGIVLDAYKTTIDNCYVAGKGQGYAIAPSRFTATNCYADSDANFEDYSNSAKKTSSEMKSDTFKNLLNKNLKDEYLTWTRSADQNSGFPTFAENKYYHLTEQISGSGSVVSTRENGRPISWAIAEGEEIHLNIQAQDKYSGLKSLKVCKASDISVVYKDFGAATASEVTFTMPAYDVVVIGEFTDSADEYSIGVVQNGVGEYSVTDGTGKTAESAVAGEKISVKVVPGVGYDLASIKIVGTNGHIIKQSTAAEMSFEMPADNCTIHITFEKGIVKYTVSTEMIGDGSGTVKLTDRGGDQINGSVLPDEEVLVYLYPAENSYPSKAVVLDADGKVIDTLVETYEDYLLGKAEDGSLRTGFVMPEGNCKVQVTYNVIPPLYDVKTELSGEGGLRIEESSGLLLDVTSPRKATENTKIKITAVPQEGYEVTSAAVYNDAGEKITDLTPATAGDTTYNYTIPAQNVTIKVTFGETEEAPAFDDEDEDGIFDIDSYEDLILLAEQIQKHPEKYASAAYEQTAHINCKMQEWALPVGTEEVPFNGTYDGNNYYILALRPTKDVSGVFGVIGENGKVSDLSVVDFDYEKEAEMAGGLAGINRGTIDNCGSGINLTSAATIFREGQEEAVPITTLDSEIKAVKVAGGIVAVNEGTIKNSRNSANVSADTAGGLVGVNEGVITNIYQTGEVNGTVAGGIAGTNSGTISYGYSSVLVKGTTRGGVVGTSENTNITGMFYFYDANEASVPTASGNQDDSILGVTKKTTSELKSKDLADELNALVASEKGLSSWVYDVTKNEGYPRHKDDTTVSAIRQNVSIAKPDPNDPVEDDQNSEKPGTTDPSKPGEDSADKVVDTGDKNVIMPYVLALIASAICMGAVLGKKRGRN